MRNPSSWANVSLDGDPILVVGRRPGARALEGFVVDLHADTFDVMRDIARSTIDKIAGSEPVDWHPNAEIEEGEQYFTVNVQGLPSRPAYRRRAQADDKPVAMPTDPHLREAAALLRIVLAPGALENLPPAQLDDLDFRFYAIVWEEGDSGRPIAFTSEYNPTQILRKAKYFFRYEGTLQLATPPDFTLNSQADLVITSDEVAVLRETAFDRLFSDIRALLNDVPANVTALERAFARLPISDDSQQAIQTFCAKRPNFARRLQELAVSSHGQEITLAKLHTALKRHGEEPTDFIRNRRVEITVAEVAPFLDVLEGRWYEADFTGEPRRAGSWSQRKPRRTRVRRGQALTQS